MQFNSLYFIIYFFPLVIAGWYLCNRKSREAADLFLLAASLLFYAYASLTYAAILIATIVVNYGFVMLLRRNTNGDRIKKRILACGVVLNAGLLVYFKYTNFLIETWNDLFSADFVTKNLILPLGISFISFTQIAFLVDSYRGEMTDVSFREFALYSAYFPKITQGPITRAKDVIPQFREEGRRIFDANRVSAGLQMFVIGLSKKILLADYFGEIINTGLHYLELSTAGDMMIATLAYTMQIYFDFSGYSDMAIGVSKMLGIDLAANFHSPYKAVSLTDFWRRWHISLTTFLREYIYFPLGGSRKGTVRTYCNIMIVYLVSGFWHGANWTFVLWGVLHGLGQVIERALRAIGKVIWSSMEQTAFVKSVRKASEKGILCVIATTLQAAWKAICWLVTFMIVNVLWLLFRSDSVANFHRAWIHLQLNSRYLNDYMMDVLRIPGARTILSVIHLDSDQNAAIFSAVLVFGLAFGIILFCRNSYERKYRTTFFSLLATMVLLIVCMLSMSDVSTFIYNNF